MAAITNHRQSPRGINVSMKKDPAADAMTLKPEIRAYRMPPR